MLRSYWILLPITVVMILTGLLRHYATVLLQSTPKKQPLAKIREQRSLLRGVNLRTNAHVISSTSFQTRKNYLVAAYKDGTFLADPEGRGKPPPNPMSDPAAMEGMMGMMKGNMAMMVPQTLIMGWINAFFSGFVISMSRPHPLHGTSCPALRRAIPGMSSAEQCEQLPSNLQRVHSGHFAEVLMLTRCLSEIALPTHTPIQIDAPIRSRYS